MGTYAAAGSLPVQSVRRGAWLVQRKVQRRNFL